MTNRPFKIGVAGTHSTGKSTLVSSVRSALELRGMKVGQVDDLATRARDLGFPILAQHTYESTLWIMAEGMRQEAEQALSSDVIIVDRPVPDALGYLMAALEVSGRAMEPRRLQELETIVGAHVGEYDLLVVTVLDPSLPLGPDRDTDALFRRVAADNVHRIMKRHAPEALEMTSSNSAEVAQALIDACVDIPVRASTRSAALRRAT